MATSNIDTPQSYDRENFSRDYGEGKMIFGFFCFDGLIKINKIKDIVIQALPMRHLLKTNKTN